MSPVGRRLTLSPIGFEIILALSQTPGGLRLAELSQVIGSPVSSVQTSLRVLIANDLVRKEGSDTPRYRLAPEHPARAALVATATVIADAARSIAVVLRANPAVVWAAVDAGGFLVGLAPEPPPDARAGLDRQLAMIDEARPGSPTVVRFPMPELDRLVRVELELRSRARGALTIKGRPPGGGRRDRTGRAAPGRSSPGPSARPVCQAMPERTDDPWTRRGAPPGPTRLRRADRGRGGDRDRRSWSAGLVPGLPSLVAGDRLAVIDLQPPGAKDFVVALFGTNDKLALEVLDRRRRRSRSGRCSASLAPALVRAARAGRVRRVRRCWASSPRSRDPHRRRRSPRWSAPSPRSPGSRSCRGCSCGRDPGAPAPRRLAGHADWSRRGFLIRAGGARRSRPSSPASSAALLLEGRLRAPSTDGRDHPAAPGRDRDPPAGRRAAGSTGLTPLVVPNDDFYRIDTALIAPTSTSPAWRLRIHGLVDREIDADLRRARRAADRSSST